MSDINGISGNPSLLRNADVGHMLELRERLAAVESERDAAIAERKASSKEWLESVANADKRTERAKTECNQIRADLALVLETARRSLTRPHPTIERIAAKYSENS